MDGHRNSHLAYDNNDIDNSPSKQKQWTYELINAINFSYTVAFLTGQSGAWVSNENLHITHAAPSGMVNCVNVTSA